MMRIAILPALLLLAACGGSADAEDAAADTAAAPPSAPARADTPADSAVAAEAAREGASAAAAQDTGYTLWDALQLPSEPWMQRAATPQALLAKVRDVAAAQLEEPDPAVLPSRMQSQAADSAVGIVIHPDLADDSVRDIEFRLHMRREGAEWAIAGVDRRERCRRGVTPDGDLCV